MTEYKVSKEEAYTIALTNLQVAEILLERVSNGDLEDFEHAKLTDDFPAVCDGCGGDAGNGRRVEWDGPTIQVVFDDGES